MSVKKLKYKNFIANLSITRKYVGIYIFDSNNKRKYIYATYDIKFSLDKPMNKEMLIEKKQK